MNPQKLVGKFVELEAINESHREHLRTAAQEESTWIYMPYAAAGENFDYWFEKALSGLEKNQLTFIVRKKQDQKIIGSSRFYNIDMDNKRLTIGYTWYMSEARGTTVNPECKLLLLTSAFETLGVNRVEFMTDSRNLHSQAALKKLGAKEEGILRQHMVVQNNYLRDTVIFSIIKSEWSNIKNVLSRRLENHAEKC
jgi:RimJ/RimL family protein N-acetyltransferase